MGAVEGLVTTNRMVYGLREGHRKLYDEAVEASKARALPAMTFKSAWGDAMKAGSDEAYRHSLSTTTQRAYEQVRLGKTSGVCGGVAERAKIPTQRAAGRVSW